MSFRSLIVASAVLLFAGLLSPAANAVTRYVSATGTGTTECLSTSPCAFLADAVHAASTGDTVVCLSPPIGGGIMITKSITIDCSGTRAQVRDGYSNGQNNALVGILINIPVSTSDPLRTVRLRGLSIDGATTPVNSGFPSGRYLDRAIEIQNALAVYVEDCVIENVSQQGIYDHRTGGQTKLYIKDTVISGNGGPGIVIAGQSPSTTVLDNVTSENNAYGIAVANGNQVMINRSVFSGNSTSGVIGDPGAQIDVNNSTISHNNIGISSSSSVRVSNNDIAFNSTAISGATGTFGNNRFSANGSLGTTPTALGPATSDLGQQ